MVVVAKPGGVPLAGRARLRPVLARLRVRRSEIPDVRRHEPDGQCPEDVQIVHSGLWADERYWREIKPLPFDPTNKRPMPTAGVACADAPALAPPRRSDQEVARESLARCWSAARASAGRREGRRR